MKPCPLPKTACANEKENRYSIDTGTMTEENEPLLVPNTKFKVNPWHSSYKVDFRLTPIVCIPIKFEITAIEQMMPKVMPQEISLPFVIVHEIV